MKENPENLPGKPALLSAGVLGFILTMLMAMTMISFLCVHWLTSGSLHEQIATDELVINEQMKRIGEEVGLLAEEYGFSQETVMHEISEEALREANLVASRWLTEAFREGKLGEIGGFKAETLEDALQADEAFVSAQDPFMLKNAAQQIRGRVEAIVTEQTLTFRETLLRTAEKKAGQAIPLQTVAMLFCQAPLMLLLASAVIAGCIALLTSRRMVLCLRYIGSSMTACGVILAIAAVLFFMMDIGNVMKEISVAAARKYELLSVRVGAEAGIAAALLAICGLFCAGTGRRAIK